MGTTARGKAGVELRGGRVGESGGWEGERVEKGKDKWGEKGGREGGREGRTETQKKGHNQSEARMTTGSPQEHLGRYSMSCVCFG